MKAVRFLFTAIVVLVVIVAVALLVLMAVIANYTCEPVLRQLGFDENNMANKIFAGSIIAGGVLALCALLTFAARRIFVRKDK